MARTTSRTPTHLQGLRLQDVVTLQRTAGNQAVRRLLRSAAAEPASASEPTTPAPPVSDERPVPARDSQPSEHVGWLAWIGRLFTRRQR
jgi:hypothetical protein